MSTRSLTIIRDGDRNEEIAVLYRHCDGYLDVHGTELCEMLAGITVVNGLSDDTKRVANGASCLAAMIVAHFKTKPGNFYLHAAGTRNLWEEYTYVVTAKIGEEPHVQVGDFNAKASDFPAYLKTLEAA